MTAIVYDIEIFPNCFTFSMETLEGDSAGTWEISQYRDDRRMLFEFFQWLKNTQTFMIGFNSVNFDYPVIHLLWQNPSATYQQLYDKAMQIIDGGDRFGHQVWASDRFAPQIDLFKMHHFDNRAKSTGLKALQINMRVPSVQDMPVENGTVLTREQIDTLLIPYNKHDVQETKRFAQLSSDAINFRMGLISQFGVDVLNWNDTKIGEQMVIQKLGDDVCYDRSSGRRQTRQTPRSRIALADIIFSYIKLENPEFARILEYMRGKVLTAEDVRADDEGTPLLTTKGAFTDLKAVVKGVEYNYGVGGIHGSVERKTIRAGNGFIIRDIDVAALYPSIAIVNNLAPAHLGSEFVRVYSELPKERKRWQKEKGKKCAEANALKLASNGVYGKSNSVFSPFYDPQFTMSITVNGQLLLTMLIEKLIEVPTLQVIQANTDGVTYYIHESYEPLAAALCREWETLTKLTLEDTDYSAMFIRDVNNYIAISKSGAVKLKGAYWTPDPCNYHQSISDAQPVSWHKNFSNVVSIRAAVAKMVYGIDIEQFIRMTLNPYDFLSSVKVNRSDKLLWGRQEVQRNTRFYVSTAGFDLVKQMPPAGPLGAYKKANGVSDLLYSQVMRSTGGQWDERVCTKNQSKYEIRETAVMAGYKVQVCNDISDFDWKTVNYEWYVQEAEKLVLT